MKSTQNVWLYTKKISIEYKTRTYDITIFCHFATRLNLEEEFTANPEVIWFVYSVTQKISKNFYLTLIMMLIIIKIIWTKIMTDWINFRKQNEIFNTSMISLSKS